ncbi:MAG: hypothetical protein JNM94_17195 [Phycisphaerae bacterium]|nr:hypothetical protein [Phycisphaerae bacterium]
MSSGITNPSTGWQEYPHVWTSADGSWSVGGVTKVDWTANPGAAVQVKLEIKDFGQVDRYFEFSFDVPICPTVQMGTTIKGITVITLTANSDGGMMTCPTDSDAAVVQFMGNYKPLLTFFGCPFTVAMEGSGNATTQLNIPPFVGPTSVSDVGSRIKFVLSGGDKATVQTQINVTANGQLPPPCLGDVDGNGAVDGFDMAFLLGYWGFEAGCSDPSSAADLNNDGTIDAIDLATMLGAWGPCNP